MYIVAIGKGKPDGLHHFRDALRAHNPSRLAIDHSVPNTAHSLVCPVAFAKYRTSHLQGHSLTLPLVWILAFG